MPAMRSNYSPMRQMSQQAGATKPAGGQNFQRQDSPDQHRFQREWPISDNRREAKHQQTEAKVFQDQQDFDLDELDIQDQEASRAKHQDQQEQAELVYIYDCCGLSSELRPSIKYMSTFQSLFCLFNFLVFTFGLANLGMGLWFRIDPKVYEIHKYIETQNFTIAGWILLFGGFLACCMSLIGFLGALKQSSTLMASYLGIMIPLTIAFVGTLVLLVVHGLGLSLEDFLVKEVFEQIRLKTMENEYEWFGMGSATQFLDFIQVKMRCCGAIDFNDYNRLGLMMPTTCYTIDQNFINAPGCARAMREIFDLRAGMASGFVSASIAVQLMTVILSALMFCSLYHARAQPKQVALNEPTSRYRDSSPIRDIPLNQTIYQQKPRSRTPIVM